MFVLIHGIGMSHRYLTRLQLALAEVGDTYSFDLPGFAATPKPPHAVSIAQYAEFIGQALDERRVASCVFIGHSMGVQIAIELAIQRPDLTSQVVLIGPVVDSRHRSAARQALALGVDSLREPFAVNVIVFGDYLRCGPRWYLRQLPVMLSYPIERRIGIVEVPVLLLRGTGDPIAGPSWCERLAGKGRRTRLLEVPGAAHVVQHSATAGVARAILDFAEVAGVAEVAGPAERISR